MIIETLGNLLEAKADAIVNAVNCVGVMGKGLALQFRNTFSEDYFKDYKRACKNGELKIGKVHVYSVNSETNQKYIIDFPTKDHWRQPGKIEYIESGLQSLVEVVEQYLTHLTQFNFSPMNRAFRGSRHLTTRFSAWSRVGNMTKGRFNVLGYGLSQSKAR